MGKQSRPRSHSESQPANLNEQLSFAPHISRESSSYYLTALESWNLRNTLLDPLPVTSILEHNGHHDLLGPPRPRGRI